MKHAIKDSKIQQVGDKEPDYELASPSQFFGSHVNLTCCGVLYGSHAGWL